MLLFCVKFRGVLVDAMTTEFVSETFPGAKVKWMLKGNVSLRTSGLERNIFRNIIQGSKLGILWHRECLGRRKQN